MDATMTRLILLFGLLIVTAATFAHEPMPSALYWSAIPVLLIVGLLAEVLHRGRRRRNGENAWTAGAAAGGVGVDEPGDMLDYIWDGFRDDPINHNSGVDGPPSEADAEPLPIENDFVDKVADGAVGGAGARD